MTTEKREIAAHEYYARQFGWMEGGDGPIIFHGPTWDEDWKAAVSWSGTEQELSREDDCPAIYDTWEECCIGEGME